MSFRRSAGLFVGAAIVLGSAAPARADDLAGEWIAKNELGIEMKLVFKADGTYEFLGEGGTWKRDGARLTLKSSDPEDPASTYKLDLKGDKLTLSGGDLENPVTFSRTGAKPAAPPEEKKEEKKGEDEKKVGEDEKAKEALRSFSREPKGAPKSTVKLTPKFKSKTKTLKDPEDKWSLTVPESWTLIPGEKDNVRTLTVNPGLQATDIVKHQIIYWVVPIPPSQVDKGFKERVDEGAAMVDKLFGSGLKREKTEILDAPGGLVARLDYDGTLSNDNVQNIPAVGTCAVTQRKMYYVLLTIVSMKEVAGEHIDDALAMLDSVQVKMKDRDPEAEKAIVGQWIVPSKTGNTWETYAFGADGTYRWHYESSYSGTFKDPGGSQTGAWGTAGQNDEAGKYEVRGDIIFFTSDKGEQGSIYSTWTNATGTWLRVGKTTFKR